MKWFRKKEEPKKESLTIPIERPRHIVPKDMMVEILNLPKDEQHKSKEIIATFLKSLNRPELLAYEDANQFSESENINEWAWEAYYEEQWNRDWPIGKVGYEDTIPAIIRNTIPDYKDLKKKVEGMQKKIDRLASIMENTEVTMSGKTALKL